jgi:uncharacterized RDD family membrane protein YckC
MSEPLAPRPGHLPPSPAAPATLSQGAYTPWLTRVAAWLIDFVPIAVSVAIGYAVLISTRQTTCVADASAYELGEFCTESFTTTGWLAWTLFAVLLPVAYAVWNFGYRQGTTGASVGKSVMKFQVVSEKTWQPVGFGLSLIRQVAHAVDGIVCYIGYLFPLWDAKRQTLADKMMTTVCVPLQTPTQPVH